MINKPRPSGNFKAKPNRAALIRKDLDAGRSYQAIAATHGCSADYVRAVANRQKNKLLYGSCESPKTLANPNYKKHKAEAVRRWQIRNRDKWNSYQRARRRAQAEVRS